jgi:hypothetical protein
MAEQDDTATTLEEVAPLRDRETGALLVPETPVEEASEPIPAVDAPVAPEIVAPVDVQPAPVVNEATALAETGQPVPVVTTPNWTEINGWLDVIDAAINTLRVKSAELRAYVAEELAKSAASSTQ